MWNTTPTPLEVLLTLRLIRGPPPVRLFTSRVAKSPGTNYPPGLKRTLHLRGPQWPRCKQPHKRASDT